MSYYCTLLKTQEREQWQEKKRSQLRKYSILLIKSLYEDTSITRLFIVVGIILFLINLWCLIRKEI